MSTRTTRSSTIRTRHQAAQKESESVAKLTSPEVIVESPTTVETTTLVRKGENTPLSEFAVDESTKNLSSARLAMTTVSSGKMGDDAAGKRSVRANKGYNSRYDQATYLGISNLSSFATTNPSNNVPTPFFAGDK